MSFVDQLAEDLATRGDLAGEARELLRAFVTEQRALLEALGEAGTRRLFEALLLPAPAAWDEAVSTLGQAELVALLAATGPQMDAAWRAKQAADRALGELLAGLSALAWRVAAQAVLAAL